jgi:hypothetical protein
MCVTPQLMERLEAHFTEDTESNIIVSHLRQEWADADIEAPVVIEEVLPLTVMSRQPAGDSAASELELLLLGCRDNLITGLQTVDDIDDSEQISAAVVGASTIVSLLKREFGDLPFENVDSEIERCVSCDDCVAFAVAVRDSVAFARTPLFLRQRSSNGRDCECGAVPHRKHAPDHRERLRAACRRQWPCRRCIR